MKELEAADLGERLRGALRDAAIPVSEEDLVALGEKGFLNAVLAFEAALRGENASAPPDFGGGAAGPGAGDGSVRPAAEAEGRARTRAGGAGAASLLELGLIEAGEGLREGRFTPLELLEASLERAAARGAELNAFHSLRADEARVEAAKAGEELRRGEIRGPLHGIPVAVKDIFDLAGRPTRAGSLILGSAPATVDAPLVARLRGAGALIIGKTSLPEFSFSPGSNNEHYGPTRNPHDPERDSGGSSAGSAAAVAEGIVPVALGSDSGGSVRIPASFCGVVGWKPAWGWASLEGTAGLSWSLDTAGTLARSLEDSLLVARVLADPGKEGRAGPASLAGLRGKGLQGLRIGAIRGEGRGKAPADEASLRAWNRGLALLEARGARIVDLELEELPRLRAMNSAILAIEAAALHRELQARRLADYGEFARLGLLVGWAYGPADYLRARQALGGLRASMLGRFAEVDLLSSPTMTSEAPALGKPPRITFTAPFNALGWPALSLPCGRGEAGLPLGFQLIGRPGDEERIFRAALALEEELGGRG